MLGYTAANIESKQVEMTLVQYQDVEFNTLEI